MSAEARLDIGGTTAEAQRAIDGLTRRVAKLTEQMRNMTAQSKAGTKESARELDSWAAGMERMRQQNDKWAQGMEKIRDQNTKVRKDAERLPQAFSGTITSVASLAAKMTTLGAIAHAAYGSWEERLDRLKQKNNELKEKLTQPLAEAGQLERVPEIEEWAGQLQKRGIRKEHAFEALKGAMEQGTLTPEQQKGVAGEAAKFGKTGMDLQRFGGLLAGIQKAAPEMAPGDVADMAILMRQKLGERAEQIESEGWQKRIMQLREGGMTGQQALDYAFHGLVREEKKGAALELLDKKFNPAKAGHLTMQERREYRRTFDPAAMMATSELTERARREDFAALQLARTPGERESANVVGLKQEIAGEKIGPGARSYENVRAAIHEGELAKGGFNAAMEQIEHPIGWQLDKLSRFLGLETSAGQAQMYASAGVKRGMITQGEADTLLRELKEQTAIMRTDSTQRPQSRLNINTHTESYGMGGSW